MLLAPCVSCARHVRLADPSCPFCGATAPRSIPRARPAPRLGRAAILAFGASIAACGPSEPAPSTPATSETSGGDHTDPSDGSAHGTPPPPPADDGGGVVALYGAPAPR